jgi:hypothetical protein
MRLSVDASRFKLAAAALAGLACGLCGPGCMIAGSASYDRACAGPAPAVAAADRPSSRARLAVEVVWVVGRDPGHRRRAE